MRKIFAGAVGLLMAIGLAGVANAAVIESFETGGYGPAWSFVGGSAPTIGAGGAHDGAFGVVDNNARWAYRTDAAATISDGSVLSAWARPFAGGRFYLGFGASAAGASSFVLGANTGQLIFQNNNSFGFSNTNATPFSFVNDWYLATVSFNSGVVTGRLYGSDGTTLLKTLVASGLSHGASGGVAVRSFSRFAFDTVSLSHGVPEPATWAMMLVGFGGLGAVLRGNRRRQVATA